MCPGPTGLTCGKIGGVGCQFAQFQKGRSELKTQALEVWSKPRGVDVTIPKTGDGASDDFATAKPKQEVAPGGVAADSDERVPTITE